ncbi:unnamed protein product [Didymodactylos carnosus]|uniref:Uncharacterized protein n=1 Tax=Didymodactylos carnosus TaxID=1234261 RepID=A0A8S2DTG0_9BILA|nr:unnamed protein product [Didymodactylos carnosus]CAF3747770.1 unnamed protein product [Didymodactylos carnosus]
MMFAFICYIIADKLPYLSGLVLSPSYSDDMFSKAPMLPDWSAIKRRRIFGLKDDNISVSQEALSVEKSFSRKWIVITSINPPTAAIKKLSRIKGWSVVLVGDTKTPKDWALANCVFLDVESQKRLSYEVHDILPYRHYSRKTLGYVYAIQHGADTIYETDDDNAFIDGIENIVLSLDQDTDSNEAYFISPQEHYMNVFENQPHYYTDNENKTIFEPMKTVNPYHYFNQRTLWPRGYPLRLIGDGFPQPITKTLVRPLVQQGLANGDPDMDAIFRLTRSDRHKRINIEFDKLPPVAIPPGVLVAFNSQNTVFHYDAFWALWIPMTTNVRVCDIWRGYFTQRLLWELKSSLTFHTASVLQIRNAHNYLIDFKDELPLYEDAERLIDFLRHWKCSTGGTLQADKRKCAHFFDRIYWLAIDMVEQKFWEMKDAWLCVKYLTDLIINGYSINHFEMSQKEWGLEQIKEKSPMKFTPQHSSPFLSELPLRPSPSFSLATLSKCNTTSDMDTRTFNEMKQLKPLMKQAQETQQMIERFNEVTRLEEKKLENSKAPFALNEQSITFSLLICYSQLK